METVKKILFLSVFALTFSAVFCSGVNAADDFESYLKMEADSFESYKDARDKAFVGFLKEQWQEFRAHKGLVRDKKPKPVVMPMAKERPLAPRSAEARIIKKVALPEKPSPEEPVVETAVAVKPVEEKPPALVISYFNTPLHYDGPLDFPQYPLESINKKSVGEFWEKMSRAPYEDFVAWAKKTSRQLNLNDWGYHSLLHMCGKSIYAGDRNMATLFVWFCSSKSGYDARIGYDSKRIYLLMPSRNRLFSVPYLTLKGRKYYGVSFDSVPTRFKSLYTYKGSYAGAEKLMDYRIIHSPGLKKDLHTRNLLFRYKDQEYTVAATYNRNLVDYFRYYPQTNIKVYFDALISSETEYSILSGLKGLVEGKSEAEAVDLLLRFVQTSFEYKTDDAHFGREKYLLPEETLKYPYSDCEDRSFFFAYLVRKLTRLEVVGLDYPGHIATAVRFSENFSGDYIVRNNRKYMVCDPTFINAGPGLAMPAVKNKKPEVIKIVNR